MTIFTRCASLCGILALAALNNVCVATVSEGYITAVNGVSVGLNPAGTSVFGYEGRSGDASQISWIYDIENRSAAQYPADLLAGEAEGGQLMWLNDTNVGVGTFRDEAWTTSVTNSLGEVEDNYPLNSACLWKDGRRIVLDHNKWSDASSFIGQDGTLPRPGNGFYAMSMTADESVILGYLKAFTYMLPVRWDRNDDGTYTSTMLHREVGQFFYLWVGASADGRRMVMNNSQSGGVSYIWDGDEAPHIFAYSEAGSNITEARLTALSPSGNLAIMSCMRDGLQAYAVYDFTAGTATWIAVPEGSASTNWFAANVVTDNGDGFICDYSYRLHYFNTALGINIPFASYVHAFGGDLTSDTAVPSKALVRMISRDGRTICGNDLQFGLETDGWIVRLPQNAPMLFALRDCEFLSASPTTALLKWRAPELPEGAVVDRYVAELDGGAPVDLEAVYSEEDELTRAYIDCPAGTHSLRLYAVARDAAGNSWESVKQDLELTISEETELFFFEDLCDSRIDESVMAYIYAHDTFHAANTYDSSVLSFRLDAGDFYNLTPFWYTCGFSLAEWHSYLESRWFDASDFSEPFYFTWQERNMTINDETRLDAGNLLMLEYTTDGENWTQLHSTDGVSNGARWGARVVDLSELAGETFRLRFHARGAGRRACEWRVDYYGILPNSAMHPAPQGLMVTESGNSGNKLAWKNNRGEYEVSYNFNSPMTFNNNLGNEGIPFYTACDYGPAKLKAYEGKYISAVATMIYEPEGVQDYHTTVKAVIFDENGNQLSEGTLADDAPWYEPLISTAMPIHHIVLDEPVLIEAGKTYRVSILITDYDPEMCPIWYFSASDDYIPGVTDLYSDDELQSWNKVSEAFSIGTEEEFNLYGRCIFNIRPCITDSPVSSAEPYCQEQWFYHVYRDGEPLPGGIAFFTQQSALDTLGGDATYTVRSFRRDGSVSEVSEPLVYRADGVELPVLGSEAALSLVRSGDTLVVVGDFDSVAVFNVLGEKVAASSVINLAQLPHGVYVISAVKDGRVVSAKYVL